MAEKKKLEKKVLTEAEKAAVAAEAQVKIAAAQERQKELNAYEARVEKMSFRQLRGELKRESRRPSDTSILTSGLASVLLTILDNTKTPENPFGKLAEYPR